MLVHSILGMCKRTQRQKDGMLMDEITSKDPSLKRQTVEAVFSINQNS